MLKGQEDKGWQKIKDDVKIQLPDTVNPYEVINQSFNLKASEWIFTVNEITKEEMRRNK